MSERSEINAVAEYVIAKFMRDYCECDGYATARLLMLELQNAGLYFAKREGVCVTGNRTAGS